MGAHKKYLLALVVVISYLSWNRDASIQKTSKKQSNIHSRMPASNNENAQSEFKLQNEKEIEILLTKISDHKVSDDGCRNDDACEAALSPRDEFYLKTKKLETEMAKLNMLVQTTKPTSVNLGDTGRDLLEYEDGSIKEQALKLLLSQPEDSENIEPVVKGVLGYHDAKLVQLAVNELQRHLTDQNAFKIHWGVRDCLLTGSLLVRDELSTLIRPFINDGSVQFYRDLSLNPQIDKKIRENLVSAVDEYQKLASGG